MDPLSLFWHNSARAQHRNSRGPRSLSLQDVRQRTQLPSNVCENLASIHDCDIYKFKPHIHSIMNLDASSLLAIDQSKRIHDEIESVKQTSMELKEMVEQMTTRAPQPLLYSQVTASNVPGRPSGHLASIAATISQSPRITQAQKRQVEPKHTLVIENVPNPIQYNNSLDLQTKIRSWDASLIPLINNAKIINKATCSLRPRMNLFFKI